MTNRTKVGERAIVVCTAKRGVFFGYAPGSAQEIVERGSVTLQRARMCTYWSASTKGVLGLASIGPMHGSRIGPMVPEMACGEITAVLVCSGEAAEVWETCPWS
jgi:hypothetical protein